MRDFGKAAKLFLETVSTFTSYELMDYTQFVKVSQMIINLKAPGYVAGSKNEL